MTYDQLCQHAIKMVHQATEILKADESLRAELPIDDAPPSDLQWNTAGDELWQAMKGLRHAALKYQKRGKPYRLQLVEQIRLVEGLV
jgi:hypothetical protein